MLVKEGESSHRSLRTRLLRNMPLKTAFIRSHFGTYNWQNTISFPFRFEQLFDNLPESTRAQGVHDRITRAGEVGEEKREILQPGKVDVSSDAHAVNHSGDKTNEICNHNDDNVPGRLDFFFADDFKHCSSLRSAVISRGYRFDSFATCFHRSPDERTKHGDDQ